MKQALIYTPFTISKSFDWTFAKVEPKRFFHFSLVIKGTNELDYSSLLKVFAQVVKLVDTPDLGSGAARYVGSSPILGIVLRDF